MGFSPWISFRKSSFARLSCRLSLVQIREELFQPIQEQEAGRAIRFESRDAASCPFKPALQLDQFGLFPLVAGLGFGGLHLGKLLGKSRRHALLLQPRVVRAIDALRRHAQSAPLISDRTAPS